jgi:hypothetical protein
MRAQTGVVELLGAGIKALAQADAGQLESLAEAARSAARPVTQEEQRVAQERLRAFWYLIGLTQRNLKLLRRVSCYRVLREHGREGLGG